MKNELKTVSISEFLTEIKSINKLRNDAEYRIHKERLENFDVLQEHFKFNKTISIISKKLNLDISTKDPFYTSEDDIVEGKYTWDKVIGLAPVPEVNERHNRGEVTVVVDFRDQLMTIQGRERELVINMLPEVLGTDKVQILVHDAITRAVNSQVKTKLP